MSKRRLVGVLPDSMRKEWDSYNKEKRALDKWVKAKMEELKTEIRERGKSADEAHVQFWDAVYEYFHLNPEGRYAITAEGKVYELDDGNPLFEAVKTFYDAELPPELTDEEAYHKLITEFDDPPEIAAQMVKERRKMYGDKIRANKRAN